MFGTLCSAAIMEFPNINKSFLSILSVIMMGLATGSVTVTNNYHIALVIFFIQGVSFGGIDTCSNCAIQDLWKQRVSPWMQALHSCFGIGAIIGPTLVGTLGFKYSFLIIFLVSLLPVIIFGTDFFLNRYLSRGKSVSDTVHYQTVKTIEEFNLADDQDLPLNNQSSLSNTPLVIKVLVTLFFFIYVGTETGYGGWLSTYLLDNHVTDSESRAAYIVAYFWGFLAFGRVLAIFLAIILSNTTMIRLQLLLTLIGSLLITTIISKSFLFSIIASASFGFGLSSLFPLAMTLISDYGFSMTSSTTTLFVVGSTFGEAVIPILIGFMMDKGGSVILPYSMLVLAILLIILYIAIHFTASYIEVKSHSTTTSFQKVELIEMSKFPDVMEL